MNLGEEIKNRILLMPHTQEVSSLNVPLQMLSHYIVRGNLRDCLLRVTVFHHRGLLVESEEIMLVVAEHLDNVSHCVFVFNPHLLHGSGQGILQTLTPKRRERLHHTLRTSPLSRCCNRSSSTTYRTQDPHSPIAVVW